MERNAAYSFFVFLAGVVFAETFRRCERKSSAFGVNIVGAVAGGLGQNVSSIVGLKALLLLAAGFYAFAALCGLLGERSNGTAEPAAAPAIQA